MGKTLVQLFPSRGIRFRSFCLFYVLRGQVYFFNKSRLVVICIESQFFIWVLWFLILHTYGQAINYKKNCSQGSYLGLSFLVIRNKKNVFSFIWDHLYKCNFGWKNRFLSCLGKKVIFKTITQAIHVYCMCVFLLQTRLCNDLQRMIDSFWLGSNSNGSRGIQWVLWNKLYAPKKFGGMGFWNVHCFNLVILSKQLWRLIPNIDSLL